MKSVERFLYQKARAPESKLDFGAFCFSVGRTPISCQFVLEFHFAMQEKHGLSLKDTMMYLVLSKIVSNESLNLFKTIQV
jgi:hypothetical protein